MGEFRRGELDAGREMLRTVARLLAWQERESFVRAASCRICGDSKRLERQRQSLEKLLTEASGGRFRTFFDIGILDTPRHVLVAGPLRLRFENRTLEIADLRDGASISESDIERGTVECDAVRCVTVENKTSFHQRTLRHPKDLHIHTSYPNAATLTLLRKISPTLEFLHFGDADPAGFDILRELRVATKLPFRAVGMDFHPSADSAILTTEEIRLLEKLSREQSLAPERPTLQTLLAAGRKGAFEQEHRPL